MNFEGRKHEMEDAQVESALRRFRESVHEWSEQEYGRTRTIRRSRWDAMWRMAATPALGWAMAAVLVASSVGIPVGVHHQRQVAQEQRLMLEQRQKLAAQEAAEQAAANARMNDRISDDELLSHVDSDIAQATPDALQPLASLMSDTSTQ
jgi:hypothetical protein